MSQASGPLVEITTNASSHEFVRRMLPVSERTGTHFPLKKMERSVCMCTYVCMYIQNPERPREAQRGPERPGDAQRGPERPREAQRSPERPREAQRGPERPCMYIPGPFQEHSHKQNYEQNCLAMYMYVYVHSRTIPGAFPQAKSRPELPCYMYVCICVCM